MYPDREWGDFVDKMSIEDLIFHYFKDERSKQDDYQSNENRH